MIALLKKEGYFLRKYIGILLVAFVLFPIIQGGIMSMIYAPYYSNNKELATATLYSYSSNDEYTSSRMADELSTINIDKVKIEAIHDEAVFITKVKSSKYGLGIRFDEEFSLLNYNSLNNEKRHLIEQLTPVLRSANQKIGNNQGARLDALAYDSEVSTTLLKQQTLPLLSSMLINTVTGMGFMIALYFANRFFRERKRDVNRRLVAFGVTSKEYLQSQWIGVFAISFFLFTIYSIVAFLMLAKLNFNVFLISLTNVVFAALIASIYTLFISIFTTERRYMAWSFPFVGIIMFLGGSFFPLDQSKNVLAIVYAMPNYHLQMVYKSIMLGKSFTTYLPSLTILVVIALAGLLVSQHKFQLGENI